MATNGSAEEIENRETIYGTLSAGQYRIVKEFDDLRATRDYDAKSYYAEFEIK